MHAWVRREGDLLRRILALGKKLFRCVVVLLLMQQNVLTERRFAEEAVSRVPYYPAGPLPGSGIVQNAHRHLFLACELPGCSHNVFQAELSVGGGCGVPHSDGGGEDALSGGSLKWVQTFEEILIFPKQSEEEYPLVTSLDDII